MVATLDYGLKKAPPEFYDGGQWLMLTQLILHANVRNRCWPTMRYLADRLNKSLPYITEAKQWLIEHKAIELVPFEERIGEEKRLGGHRHVYQLTGILDFGQLIVRYLYVDPENGQDGDDDQLGESSTKPMINLVNDQIHKAQTIPSIEESSNPTDSDTTVSSSQRAEAVAMQQSFDGEPDTEGVYGTSKDLDNPQPPSSARPPSPVTQVAPPPDFRPFVHPLMIVCPACGSAHKSWYVRASNSGDIQQRRWYCIMCGQTSAHPAMCFKDDGTQDISPANPAPVTTATADAPEGYMRGYDNDYSRSFAYIRHLCKTRRQTTAHGLSERLVSICKPGGRHLKTHDEINDMFAVTDCPDCQRIAAERSAPKAKAPRKAQPWDAFGNEVARVLFDAKDQAGINAVMGRVAPILHGDKKSGRCIGLIEYECQRQKLTRETLDYVLLTASVVQFYTWYRTQCDKPLKDCAKVLDYWQAWRTSAQSGGTPTADDAWVWIDDPDVPGGNVKKRVHKDYLHLYQGGAQ